MFQAVIDPVAGNLALSALVACIPLIVFFVCLVAIKLKAHVSAIIALTVSIIIAIVGFKMPAGFTFLSATQGAAYGIFPVCLIIVAAVWFYEITVVSGRSEDLRRLFDRLGGGDLRIQAVLIAFCFGALLEALAGFGAPIAITATMILALGIPPVKSAMAVLIANTAPVAFGALAIPITTAGNMAPGVDGALATAEHVAAISGCIAPIFSTIVPCLIIFILDRGRGLKDCWVPALITGLSFGITQWFASNFLAYEMTDVIAALVSFGVTVLFLRFWKLRGVKEARARFNAPEIDLEKKEKLPASRSWMALMPYAVVVVIFYVGKRILPLTLTDIKIPWPGLTEIGADGAATSLILNYAGADPGTTFTFNWLSNCGTLMIIAGLLVAFIYSICNYNGQFKITVWQAIKEFGKTCVKMRLTILTITCVLALAYVMNFSGQTISIGQLLAQTGAAFAFISPVLGWVGTAVTGSDTSANALFSSLQVEAAKANPALAGVDPELFLASNTMGGVMGKMVSPQSLAIAAAAVEETESKLFRSTLRWSLILLAALCVIIFLYAGPLGFIVP
ncbi:MAG: L-lactate permease [Coriobacteriales bacterium]|nr:L-lactate permease [Coriobacteriales bacterium]